MTLTNILLTAVLMGIAVVLWKAFRARNEGDPLLQAELDRRKEEIGELKNMVDEVKSENNELKGKGKQLAADYMKVQAANEGLATQVAEYKAVQKQREKDQQQALMQLDSAKRSLEDEKMRIRHDDEKRIQKEIEERDRMWAEHEISVISLLTDLCKKPQHAFTSYDNNNLPEGFHGNLKPDFLIEFLEQYVIFDAKISKATNLQVYIDDQVKKTAAKVKGKEGIYSRIFLVVPTNAISELKKTYYYEEGFHFYIVSPEALAPILASLKHIESYETIEGWDPQEREAIIDLITQLDYHISLRNFADYQLMQHGIDTLSKTQVADTGLAKEVAIRKAKMRALNFKTADQKSFIANPELLREKLLELTEPQSKMQKEDTKR
ncbi:MAG: hypothetical protein PHX87_05855 [Candidatus Peribacteraceae bacterium]|nr:hypothetical protein [Candidatus Peribacteraceae bacterium]MDD5742916.1 hypothetical protein [Candidatus Peribacteraceae bacterium]